MLIENKNDFVRSPFFYVGDKFKLLPQITERFPVEYERLVEPFVGGGSVFLNSKAKKVLANDLNESVISIHQLLYSNRSAMDSFITDLKVLAKDFSLTCSSDSVDIPNELRIKYPKTYFAEMNRNGYTALKEKFNSETDKNYLELYALMIYGFNRMIRFNKKGEFNIPVGNVDLNQNVIDALHSYASRTVNREIKYSKLEFDQFIKGIKFTPSDFVYLDPPYLITASEYNKNWNERNEIALYALLDELSDKGVKFALSNVEIYGDRENSILTNWMNKYSVTVVKSNYINYFDNKKKKIKEVLVCNYE